MLMGLLGVWEAGGHDEGQSGWEAGCGSLPLTTTIADGMVLKNTGFVHVARNPR